MSKMKRISYNGIIALIILCVGCSHSEKNHPVVDSKDIVATDSVVRVDTSLIEQWTHRELLCVDTIKLHPHELRDLNRYLEGERKITKSNVMYATGYQLGDGFEVLHLRSNNEYSCEFACPDGHLVLSECELAGLCSKIDSLPIGIAEHIEIDSVMSTRTIKSTGDSLVITLERECKSPSCEGATLQLTIDKAKKLLSYHVHHRYFCQTHGRDYYEFLVDNR